MAKIIFTSLEEVSGPLMQKLISKFTPYEIPQWNMYLKTAACSKYLEAAGSNKVRLYWQT